MTFKKIETIIPGSCNFCPYSQYDPDYGRSYDSGYDCKKEGKRISDDYEITKYREYLDKLEEREKELDLGEEIEVMEDPMTIPDWCPLEDYTEGE